MDAITSRTRAQGASVITTVPAEAARRMGLEPGQDLQWIEDGLGGFRVVPHSAETAEGLEAHARVIAEYDSVFRALAG
jgi:bifunctional DNA-binding transcriptional regulator/antitoxin component of YhaV-PrlF toxin-antitoxin module